MPNSDMLYIRMIVSDRRCGVFQPIRKPFLVGVKVCPTALKLRFAVVIKALPVIVDDEIRDWMD